MYYNTNTTLHLIDSILIYTKASLSCLGVSNLTTLAKSKNVFCLFFISVSLVSTNYCFRFFSQMFIFILVNKRVHEQISEK